MHYEFTVTAGICVENSLDYKNKATKLININKFILLSTLNIIIELQILQGSVRFIEFLCCKHLFNHYCILYLIGIRMDIKNSKPHWSRNSIKF